MTTTTRMLIFAGAGIALAALLAGRGRKWFSHHHKQEVLDEALADTFPASDPVATQDYAVPANRRGPEPATSG